MECFLVVQLLGNLEQEEMNHLQCQLKFVFFLQQYLSRLEAFSGCVRQL